MRFVRRDGLRVFLDSRDLIHLIEHARPVDATIFARELTKRNARLVLTYTNVAEFLPRTRDGAIDRARALSLVRSLEQLPLAYLRQPELVRREFREALAAYDGKRPVRRIDGYVDEWWQTFSKTPAEFVPFVDPTMSKLLSGMSLADQVSHLIESGDDLMLSSALAAPVAQAMEDDRQAVGARRGLPATWRASVEWQFHRFGWPEPAGGFAEFVEFIRTDSNACPGWRLGVAVYEEFRSNLTATLRPNDIPDFSHVHFLPYVTHATLDAAWRDRCERAYKRLAAQGASEPAFLRVHADVNAILASW
jgi:hypothetical protein